ncbi:MAG: hypothetical protein V1249_06845, partial [Acidimicrobiales bacterium]|nr:hypothetical protein [Acidimicrobiales bacterium]
TTTVSQATTTLGVDEVRYRFIADAGAEGALADLSDTDLGCVADALLEVSGTGVVLSIASQGPKPHQAAMTVDALVACGVVGPVFRAGLVAGMATDPTAPDVGPECLLEGVSVDQLVPVLVTELSRPGGVSVDGSDMDVLLFDTPLMVNMMRCPLEAAGELTPFCAGYFDVIDELLRLVLSQGSLEATSLDPVAFASLFHVAEGVFAWLATNAPEDLGGSAVLVHDAVIVVDEAFVDAVAGMEDDTPEARDTALLAASSRIGAGLEGMNAGDLPTATTRLRSHIVDECGAQATVVFDLFGGFGAGFIEEG